jgi:hypothetical protein
MENAESSRPSRRLVLFVSLSLNLTLVLFLALTFEKPAAVPAIQSPDNTSQASERISRTKAKRFAAPWSQLESTDLAVYAANLRAAGCPPKTVRDILLPLVEEKFAPPVYEPTNIWASFSQRQAAAAARAGQESALEKEKDKTLQELFGFAWISEGLKQAYAGEAAGSVGFLEYEHAEKFLCLADRFKKQFSRADGSHRTDRRSAIYQTWRQELGEVLSPAEFEEIDLREILTIWQPRNPNLFKVGLSGSELRQLMAFRRELCNPLPTTSFAKGDELLQEPDWTGEQQFNAKARLLLGDSRFIDYLKSGDASMGRTLATLKKEHLPRSLALQLFDFRQEAMARAQEIRELPLRRTEKRTHLAALRQNAIEQIAALSNAATDSPLVEINRDWLQEIANP